MDAITLAEYRANKDKYFREDHHSPVPPEKQADFVGLTYYAWNPDLVFTVPVADDDRSPTTIATTDGAERTYYTAGVAELLLSGEIISLTVYDTGHPGLFLPFRDATSGIETYGAGRYLDLQPNQDGTVTIDFNLAYHPFCAYNDAYSCALPPVANWLTVPIRAGERT